MESALIGDIGATNARFAVLQDGVPSSIRVLPVASYASLHDAIEAYFEGLEKAGPKRPRVGALAVAGPVTGDFLSFTNHPWSFSISGLAKELGFTHLDVINDFVAVALAVPRIKKRRQVGAGEPVAGAPVGIIGPGSGLGVSIVVPVDEGGVFFRRAEADLGSIERQLLLDLVGDERGAHAVTRPERWPPMALHHP